MEPLVSILTPCYNGEKFISNYVNSIFKQDYSNIEVIFVDDGSNDATKQLILGYENEFLARKISFQYIWKENNGAASAIEKGIKNVKGKYLTWIDVDDSMHSDYISKKVRFLEENTDKDLVISRCTYIEQSTGEKVGCSWKDIPIERKELIHRLLLNQKFDFEPGNFMVRMSSFDAMNPQRYIYISDKKYVGQNIQLLLPIVYLGETGFLQESLYDYYIHTSNHHLRLKEKKEKLEAIEEIEKTYRHTIDAMSIDNKEKLMRVVFLGSASNKLGLAIRYKDKELGKKAYRFLKQEKHLGRKDRIKYIISQNGLLCEMFVRFKR